VSLACALVESIPTTLDDNLTVPLAGAVLFPLFAQADPLILATDPDLGRRVALGLVLNGAIALVAWRARSLDWPEALSALVLPAGPTAVPLRDLLVRADSGAVATAAADTCSSEIGKAYGRRTFLITSFRPVPPGTEGAISLEGTLGGLLGAVLVAAVGAALGVYSWPLAGLVTLAGLLGSLAESVIGTVAERRGWLDNNLLNALNTAIGAAFAVLLIDLSAGVGLAR